MSTPRQRAGDSGAPSTRRDPSTGDDPPTVMSAGLLSDHDLWLFNEGRMTRLHDHLGAQYRPRTPGGERLEGTVFSVWAPGAARVTVMGDFDGWDRGAHELLPRGSSGIWQAHVPDARPGHAYKYVIRSATGGHEVDKADPVGFYAEVPPRTASVVWDLDYEWGDDEWMRRRAELEAHRAPISIYEVHLGSWAWDEQGNPLGYRDIARPLADHVERLGFTHVEFLPLMEHPFYGSWGYQTTGYFSPTARYGTPQDLMHLVDHLHQRGIGVVLDWVPSHFPTDEHGLGYFDGTHLYEHADPRKGFHPDWQSFIFNYDRHEVRSFLLSSANFWLDRYHADAIRVDAVASMLYLDYSREDGEWIPNEHGGNENLGALRFLRELNEVVYAEHPGAQTFAEESTAWPMVSRPTYVGGLGFGFKWDMGWMHDTLQYLQREPVYRRYHHDEITFRAIYAFTENYTLPLSHDEVVHGKGSLLGKMPGDQWQRFANLRLLYGYQWAQPGKKLLFMGGELAQPGEWSHGGTVDWPMLRHPEHEGVRRWIEDLNRLYGDEPALHELDCDPDGFEWVEAHDADDSVLVFLRRAADTERRPVLVACNFTPVVREGYRIGVPEEGPWFELANSDRATYGGSDLHQPDAWHAEQVTSQGRDRSIAVDLPPLAVLYLAPAHPGS